MKTVLSHMGGYGGQMMGPGYGGHMMGWDADDGPYHLRTDDFHVLWKRYLDRLSKATGGQPPA